MKLARLSTSYCRDSRTLRIFIMLSACFCLIRIQMLRSKSLSVNWRLTLCISLQWSKWRSNISNGTITTLGCHSLKKLCNLRQKCFQLATFWGGSFWSWARLIEPSRSLKKERDLLPPAPKCITLWERHIGERAESRMRNEKWQLFRSFRENTKL